MNEEMLAKLKELKEAKSAEEILSIAKRNGREVTAEEAQAAFDALHAGGELSDDDLAKVAGGSKVVDTVLKLLPTHIPVASIFLP